MHVYIFISTADIGKQEAGLYEQSRIEQKERERVCFKNKYSATLVQHTSTEIFLDVEPNYLT